MIELADKISDLRAITASPPPVGPSSEGSITLIGLVRLCRDFEVQTRSRRGVRPCSSGRRGVIQTLKVRSPGDAHNCFLAKASLAASSTTIRWQDDQVARR